jgi:hypothetical protein
MSITLLDKCVMVASGTVEPEARRNTPSAGL